MPPRASPRCSSLTFCGFSFSFTHLLSSLTPTPLSVTRSFSHPVPHCFVASVSPTGKSPRHPLIQTNFSQLWGLLLYSHGPSGDYSLRSKDTDINLPQTNGSASLILESPAPLLASFRTDCLSGSSPPPTLLFHVSWIPGQHLLRFPVLWSLCPFFYAERKFERGCLESSQNLNASWETQLVPRLPWCVASARARFSPPSSLSLCFSPSLYPSPLLSLFHSPFFPRGPGNDVSLSLSNCLHISEQQGNWL